MKQQQNEKQKQKQNILVNQETVKNSIVSTRIFTRPMG